MRKYVLTGIAIIVVMAIAGYLVWRVLEAIYQLFVDRQLYREMDEIERQSEAQREKKRQENEKRLDTGCDHNFEDDRYGALPPDVCGKCGISREKPNGPCDHLWKVIAGPAPAGRCEKCGKRYSPLNTNRSALP